MIVGIKFCGGCNPRIDRVGVAEAIKKRLIELGITVVYNNSDADFIVYLSGCSSSCAARYSPVDKPSVEIAGVAVNGVAASEESLSDLVIEKVREQLGKLEKSL